jgi:hypothetical protein
MIFVEKMIILTVCPWLWKKMRIKEEKGECKLCGRHSDYYWVEVSKKEEKMEQSKEKQSVG